MSFIKQQIVFLCILVTILICFNTAQARDTRHLFKIEEVLNSPQAKEKLDPKIKFYFGAQETPPVVKNLGEWKTNKKTNAFGKSDQDACEWAMLSALIELQDRAKKEGGNAVINIKSNYKNQETTSNTEYMYGAGGIMAGVALKGTVVVLKE